jgi:SAM-dependent methyltransferase
VNARVESLRPGDFRHLPLKLRRTPPIKQALHGAIYRWIAARVERGTVLDLGCAEGFGAAILAESAARVTAIDWDADLIAEARRAHSHERIEYRVQDCQAPLDADGYDAVVVNALVEHVGDVDALMGAAVAALRPGGSLFCGTKNSDTSFKKRDGSPLYDNHLREYTATGLAALLERGLADARTYLVLPAARARRYLTNSAAVGAEDWLVRLGIKEKLPRGLRRRLRGWLTGVRVEELGAGDFEIVPWTEPEAAREAWYVLATGRKAGPPLKA